ncbi:MAG: glycosyltransferase family 2 protein [Candidatus Omnitrophota bacterium]
MKLIIQIPCLNEALSLPGLFAEIPKKIEGVEIVETLVIDDGSTDGTSDIAKGLGARHILKSTSPRGLAKAFMTGIDTSLKLGADIIVNLDGDGQYDPKDIPALIKPIIEKQADMVIGNREVEKLKHFSPVKKILQKLGSFVVQKFSNTKIPDVTSGFRAFSKEAALSINVVSDFTYTLETLIQAGAQNLSLAYVPVKSRPVKRKSRLFKTIREYVMKSTATMIRIYTMYKPLKVFTTISFLVFGAGVIVFTRFLYLRMINPEIRPIQHLIAATFIFVFSFQIFLIGLLADLISANRKLSENILKKVKRLELSQRK